MRPPNSTAYCPHENEFKYRLDQIDARLGRIEDRQEQKARFTDLTKLDERVDFLAESNIAMASSLEILRSGQLTRAARLKIWLGVISGFAAIVTVLIKVVLGS